MYRLLSATPSPYARKVRVALIEKGIPFALATEIPWHPGSETERLNPLQKLPVLLADGAQPVWDSSLILDWLELRHPEPPLLPAGPEARFAARRFEVLSAGICDAVVLILMERLRAEGSRSAPWIDRQMRKVTGGLAELARTVPLAPPILPGPGPDGGFGLADIAVGCALGYLGPRLPELDWRSAHPGLAAFLNACEARPSFAQTMPVPQAIDPALVV